MTPHSGRPKHCYGARAAERRLADASDVLDSSTDSRQALAIEAKAASVYWAALADLPVRFADADAGLIPERWSTVGERHSIISSKPRLAISPAHAILNFLYHLATAEASLALLALGLDPGLGWAHRDAPYRDSAALDLVEAVRPTVDEYVFGLIAERTFSRREFVELPTGQVRLAPSLAKLLAESTLSVWESAVVAHSEEVVRMLARSAGPGVPAPKAATRGAGGKGQGALGRGSSRYRSRPKSLPGACRSCGTVLEASDRVYCPDCVPQFQAERTAKLVRAAKSNLTAMRQSEKDPTKTPEAIAKRVAKVARRKEEARVWEQTNPGPHDEGVFRKEILPELGQVTIPTMMRATGLTSSYCWKIRRGERIPLPMYWEAFRLVAEGMDR